MNEIITDFYNYKNSLPKPLDAKEQEILLYTYSKTKDENIREKIIEHNLRLCANFALEYATKYNQIKEVEDINSECIIAMT
jgi:DNA-directed RNA polymerase specialized sigma subunit